MTNPENSSGSPENTEETILSKAAKRYGEGAKFCYMWKGLPLVMTLVEAMQYCEHIALAPEEERWSELDAMFLRAEEMNRRKIEREISKRAIDA